MNFDSPRKALETIEAGRDVEWIRSENRRKVQDLMNCVPPIDADTAKKMNLKVNVNWGEGAVLAWHARRQYANAFIKPKRYFKVIMPDAPEPKRMDWELFITKRINRYMKRDRCYTELWKYRIASIVLDGIGPQHWPDQENWRPRFISLDNLRIPTDTLTSFENLEWFAERREYTPGELSERVFGEYSMPGWNKDVVKSILKEYHDKNFEETDYDWSDQPEKMAELYKQNGHFYAGDAVPSIRLWHLFYKDRRDTEYEGWKHRVVPDRHVRGIQRELENQWVFNNGDKVIAEDLDRILHVQFGDLSSKAPFKYHSVRSLGFMLMEPCFYTNLMRCRLLQHVFENFNIWLRTADPAGRARAQMVELTDRAFIPEGVGIVPRTERHQIDPQLVSTSMAQLRQLMQETSSSYTQEVDSGTKKEQTAYETAVKMSLVNAMMSGLLSNAFSQEVFAYREIARRFCREDTDCKDAKNFQRDCIRYGIPRKFIDEEEWDIEPEIPIGAGNPVAEQSQVKALMEVRPMLNPVAQQDVLHKYVAIMTDNPNEAERLVPLEESQYVSDAVSNAEFSFPVLMRGLPIRPRPELNLIDQIETYIRLLKGTVTLAASEGNMSDFQDLVGMRNVERHVTILINQLAQDETMQQRVKVYMDTLGKLMNEVKGFEQRLAEQQQAEQGGPQMDPKVQSKIASDMAKAQSDQQLAIMRAEAEEERKNLAFANEQGRKDAEVAADIERKNLEALAKPPAEPKPPAKKK